MSTVAQRLQAELETYTAESIKFEGGNNAAGTRARKALQAIKKLAQEGRKEISEARGDGDDSEPSTENEAAA